MKKILLAFVLFSSLTLCALSEKEILGQVQSALCTKGVGEACLRPGHPFKKKLDVFSGLLKKIPHEVKLHIKFIQLFVYKSGLLGIIPAKIEKWTYLVDYKSLQGDVSLRLLRRGRSLSHKDWESLSRVTEELLSEFETDDPEAFFWRPEQSSDLHRIETATDALTDASTDVSGCDTPRPRPVECWVSDRVVAASIVTVPTIQIPTNECSGHHKSRRCAACDRRICSDERFGAPLSERYSKRTGIQSVIMSARRATDGT